MFDGRAGQSLAVVQARRSPVPCGAEFRNLSLYAAAGGAWVAVTQFNLLPSALLGTMLTVDKIGVAGWRFLARTVPPQVATCLVVWALLGFPVRLESSMANIVADRKSTRLNSSH